MIAVYGVHDRWNYLFAAFKRLSEAGNVLEIPFPAPSMKPQSVSVGGCSINASHCLMFALSSRFIFIEVTSVDTPFATESNRKLGVLILNSEGHIT